MRRLRRRQTLPAHNMHLQRAFQSVTAAMLATASCCNALRCGGRRLRFAPHMHGLHIAR